MQSTANRQGRLSIFRILNLGVALVVLGAALFFTVKIYWPTQTQLPQASSAKPLNSSHPPDDVSAPSGQEFKKTPQSLAPSENLQDDGQQTGTIHREESGSATQEESPLLLNWEALMPKGWQPENPLDKLSQEQLTQLTDEDPKAAKLLNDLNDVLIHAPTVKTLNHKRVRLPGFVIPVEFEGKKVREFLLVPYFGACIHVPPPPANQMVYVKSSKPVEIAGLYAIVWVVGQLSTQRTESDIAKAGYTLQAESVEPYQ